MPVVMSARQRQQSVSARGHSPRLAPPVVDVHSRRRDVTLHISKQNLHLTTYGFLRDGIVSGTQAAEAKNGTDGAEACRNAHVVYLTHRPCCSIPVVRCPCETGVAPERTTGEFHHNLYSVRHPHRCVACNTDNGVGEWWGELDLLYGELRRDGNDDVTDLNDIASGRRNNNYIPLNFATYRCHGGRQTDLRLRGMFKKLFTEALHEATHALHEPPGAGSVKLVVRHCQRRGICSGGDDHPTDVMLLKGVEQPLLLELRDKPCHRWLLLRPEPRCAKIQSLDDGMRETVVVVVAQAMGSDRKSTTADTGTRLEHDNGQTSHREPCRRSNASNTTADDGNIVLFGGISHR
eukprot:PhM_4_TR13285/c0_g1_i1/m.36376